MFCKGCDSSDLNLISDFLLFTKPHLETFNAFHASFQAFQISSDFFRLFLTDALTPLVLQMTSATFS